MYYLHMRAHESVVEGRRRALEAARAAAELLRADTDRGDAPDPSFVLVARGGLLLYPALLEAFPAATYLIISARRRAGGVDIHEDAAELATLAGGSVVVVDAVIATGTTVREVVAIIRRTCSPSRLLALSLSCTQEAEKNLSQHSIPVITTARDDLVNGIPSIDLGGLDAGDTFAGQPTSENPDKAGGASAGGRHFAELVRRSSKDAQRRLAIHDAVVSSGAWSQLARARILDVGCGDGALTERLHREASAVRTLGYDPDPECVRTAREESSAAGIEFTSDWEVVTGSAPYVAVNICMVLSAEENITPILARIKAVADYDGRQVWTIPHPAFTYNEQINQARLAIEDGAAEVSMNLGYDGYLTLHDYTKQRSGIGILHFHRPLAWYLDALVNAGFTIRRFREPSPQSGHRRPSRLMPRICIIETSA